jgi:hypothetical protein
VKNLDLRVPGKEALTTSITAVVENKPQLLRPMRPFLGVSEKNFGDLTENGRYVLEGLYACFQKQGYVKEGITQDIFFGFEVSGYDLSRVAFGLIDLKRAGYIFFTDDAGVTIDEHSDNLKNAWVRYTKKLLNPIQSG